MFNKTRFCLQGLLSLFFQGKASHINEKIVCMVEYIQLTTVFFLFVFSSFFIRSQTKQVNSCIVFLCALSSSPPGLPYSPPSPHGEDQTAGPVRNRVTVGHCGPGLKRHWYDRGPCTRPSMES